MRRSYVAAVVAAALIAAGCETPSPRQSSPAPAPAAPPPRTAQRPPQPTPPPEPVKPPVPVKTAAEVALDEGITLYDAGSYNEAIKSLTGAKEIWDGAPDALKVRAYKYVAFSQCVLGRRTACRQQFTEALKLDPNFALEPAERTPPIWGVEYEAAKKALASPPARPAAATTPAAPRPAQATPPASGSTAPKPPATTPKPPGT
jgi:tetratricopeptide (TPR) repeat protein